MGLAGRDQRLDLFPEFVRNTPTIVGND